MRTVTLPQRQIHLDFHTGPAITDVGAEFDARDFARTMKCARVRSVTVFAKCHHGHLYFNTRHPARHPGLRKGFDLLAAQVRALHAEDIRAPIYISVQCDEFAANTHPEWIALNPDNTRVAPKPTEAGWQILDMSSPYQEYLAAQTREILRAFRPVDGIFFDMCWNQVSVSPYAKAGMHKAGLDPTNADHRNEYARRVALAYMKRFSQLVKASTPGATVYFNSRPLTGMPEEIAFMTHVEIEALPTGGWGYLYFPKNVRYARNFGKPCLGVTGRFHKSWADFGGLKPQAALQYEVCQMLANGAHCSIGDQLHPRGQLDQAVYDLIGSVYSHAEACEPWTTGAKPVADIGVVRSGQDYYDAPGCANDGVTRMLTQLKWQFDFVDITTALDRYRVVIVPDGVTIDAGCARVLRRFARRGGGLLISGHPLALAADAGVTVLGESPYTTTYLRFGKAIDRGVAPADHVVYERGWRMKPVAGGETLAHVVEPYFERSYEHFSSHFQTPALTTPSAYAAAVRKGNLITIAFPVFRSYATHGNLPYRQLVQNCLCLLHPRRRIEVTGPSGLEATVMRQKNRLVIHLLYFTAERRTPTLDIIEDIVPLHDVSVAVCLPCAPMRVYLAPSKMPLDFEYRGGRVRLNVPRLDGHAMVVVEGAIRRRRTVKSKLDLPR